MVWTVYDEGDDVKEAIVEITPELLEQMLQFDQKLLRITGASWREFPNTYVLLRIKGEALPDRCRKQPEVVIESIA